MLMEFPKSKWNKTAENAAGADHRGFIDIINDLFTDYLIYAKESGEC